MNQKSSAIPKDVEAHYLETKESERLSGVPGELERLRTLEILARVLPPAPAVIFDIGGAAGAYSFPLSQQGYVVHLIAWQRVSTATRRRKLPISQLPTFITLKNCVRVLSVFSSNTQPA